MARLVNYSVDLFIHTARYMDDLFECHVSENVSSVTWEYTRTVMLLTMGETDSNTIEMLFIVLYYRYMFIK